MQKDKSIFFSIMGIIIIILLLWNRLIRERLPRELTFFTDKLYMRCFVYFTITLLFYVVIMNLWLVFKKYHVNKKQSMMLIYISNILLKYKFLLEPIVTNLKKFINSPKILYETLIFENINITRIMERPLVKLEDYLMKHNETSRDLFFKLIYIMFNTIPKMVVLFAFLLDIFINHYLQYFYKIGLLLFIPIIYDVFTYTMNDLYDKYTYYASAHIEVIPHGNNQREVRFHDEIPLVEDGHAKFNTKNKLPKKLGGKDDEPL